MGVVIGITGRNCAGKDTVAAVLQEQRGFERYSLSDVLRAVLRERGEEITRPALIALGTELRTAEGPGTLAIRVRSMMKTDRVALVSVRNPIEVERLREIPGFVLWAVDAPVAERFARESARGRESLPATLEEFQELEARENTSNPNAQQLDATIALCDSMIMNDGTLEDLEARVFQLLAPLEAVASGESR
jgi:dephospho-CoA kinase